MITLVISIITIGSWIAGSVAARLAIKYNDEHYALAAALFWYVALGMTTLLLFDVV